MTEFNIMCKKHDMVAENIEPVAIDVVIKKHIEEYDCDSTWITVIREAWTDDDEAKFQMEHIGAM